MSSTVQRAVVVMGKLPRPGRVKTRLTRSLTNEQAAALYRAFLMDTFRLVDRARRDAKEGWRRVFACALAPGESLDQTQGLAPEGWEVVEQTGVDLGDRIENARRAGRARHVLVMGSDSPTLPAERLVEAFVALDRHEGSSWAAGRVRRLGAAVLVPTEDGGYAVVGFSEPAPELLSGIPWSTAEVMTATRVAASKTGRPLIELAEAYDVDHPEDLERLRADLDPTLHPATVSALASVR